MVARRVGGNRVPPSCESGQQDAGDHKGPPNRPSSALAPTEYPTLFRYVDAYEGRIHLSKCIIAPLHFALGRNELRPYIS